MADSRYADDFGESIWSLLKNRQGGKDRFLIVRQVIINAWKSFCFSIKFVLSTWDTNPKLKEEKRHLIFDQEGKKERFIGQEWDLVKDTQSKSQTEVGDTVHK